MKNRYPLKTELKIIQDLKNFIGLTSSILFDENKIPKRKYGFIAEDLYMSLTTAFSEITYANRIKPENKKEAKMRYESVLEGQKGMETLICKIYMLEEFINKGNKQTETPKWFIQYINTAIKINNSINEWIVYEAKQYNKYLDKFDN